MKENFSEDDLRYWEACKLNGFPLPDIPEDELIRLWGEHGFSLGIVAIMKAEFYAQIRERAKWQ